MKKIVPLATSIFLALAAAGCSRLPVTPEPAGRIPHAAKVDLADSQGVKEQLYLQYQQWKGTNYKMGGLSKQGIDCSGFVYITYLEKLGIELPRTTELQSRIGKEVKRVELRAGDLVFFKTGVKVRHVGMYVENGKFLHASTKQGVTISKLTDYYWGKKFWHARRINE